MKLHIIRGSALSGKTGFLAEKMVAAHRENPLSYTFLGPSGVFVREFSEWFARGMNSSIPRSNFLVIDQFAVELFGSIHPDMIHADEHLLHVFIASILESASQEELGSFYTLKDSLRLAAFVGEAVKDAKDDAEAEFMARLANDQARSLMQFVLKELEVRYGSNLFDTFDVYRDINTEELRGYVKSRFGNKLFLDGFTNLSDAQKIFLYNILPLFDEAFMTLDPALMTSESWIEFKGMLEAKSIEIYEKQLMSSVEASAPLERLLLDQGPQVCLEGSSIQIAHHKDPEEELIQVCRQIKRRIVDDGMEPGDIAIVLNNFSERAREFSRKLEEYGIPVRVSGEEPLSSSIAVQLLILPFKAALAGYPSHLLISMLDHGLGITDAAELDLDGLDALASGAGLHMGPRRGPLKDRKGEWMSKLEDHLRALRQRLEVLSQDESVYDSELQAHQAELQLCQELVLKAEELFQSLERIEAARVVKSDLNMFLDETTTWMASLKARFINHPDLESEVMAISKVELVLGRLKVIHSTMGNRNLTLSEFVAFLEILLASEEYRPSPSLANTVEILSLHYASAILHRMDPITFSQPDSWLLGVQGKKTTLTVQDVVKRIFDLSSRRAPGKAPFIVIDEVGQYVARSNDKLEDLRALVEELGRVGMNQVKGNGAVGPAWLVVTSQQRLEEVVADLDSKRILLTKLLDRFVPVDLAPSDIKEVATRRVLGKKKDSEPLILKY